MSQDLDPSLRRGERNRNHPADCIDIESILKIAAPYSRTGHFMSLDLFFVPRKPAFEQLREPGFSPTPGMIRARRKLVGDLISAFPGTRLQGSESSGSLADFPRGELSLHPGYVSWSLHGVADEAPVREVVSWFLQHGHVCEDPQDAGFANRDLRRGSVRSAIESFEELVGAQFVGLRLQREWGFGIGLDWLLADGCPASIDFFFGRCLMPDIAELVEQRVSAVHLEPGRAELGEYDTLHIFFPGDIKATLEKAIYRKSTVVRTETRTVG